MRHNYSSGSPWEDVVGYSRCVRVGNLLEVAGTTASDSEGRTVWPGDMYQQTRFILQKIERALQEAGSGMQHVVRTRSYVTNIAHWEAFAKAHAEYFGDVRPVSTLVEVSRLIHPDMLVEIEVTAVIPDA